MSDYVYEAKENHEGKKVIVLGPTFDEGKPDTMVDWRAKLTTREDAVDYLRTAFRYWYGSEWYGSEKRKQEA